MRERTERPNAVAQPSSDESGPSKTRSIAKAISWRLVGSLDTLILSYVLITFVGPYFGLETDQGEAAKAAGMIAFTEMATKIVLYYLHERGWERTKWGTVVTAGRRRETYRRTTAKTASWRTLASLDTIVLAFLFTGNIATALSIGGLEVITKLILYFLHERAWSYVSFGMSADVSGTPQGKAAEA